MTVLRPSNIDNIQPVPHGVSGKSNKIAHYILQCRVVSNGDKNNLDYYVQRGSDVIPKSESISDYISRIKDSQTFGEPSGVRKKHFDLYVDGDCWVVLQLGQSISNWRFQTDKPAVRNKPGSKVLSGLSHYAFGSKTGEEYAPEGCRICCFLASGLKDDESINIHTEFVRTDGAGNTVLVMPIIFDPDVKNGGDTRAPI